MLKPSRMMLGSERKSLTKYKVKLIFKSSLMHYSTIESQVKLC